MDLQINPHRAEPPFEQVRQHVVAGAVNGSLPAGSRLPTVRQLADDLGLAVNTVAKAYRALEGDGVIETRGRAGTFVAERHIDDRGANAAAVEYVRAARRGQVSKAEALILVERHWD